MEPHSDWGKTLGLKLIEMKFFDIHATCASLEHTYFQPHEKRVPENLDESTRKI